MGKQKGRRSGGVGVAKRLEIGVGACQGSGDHVRPLFRVQSQRILLGDVIRCALCDRAGGHLPEGEAVCTLCRLELAPTRVHLAMSALGMSGAELAAQASVSLRSVRLAIIGHPMGAKVAPRLSGALGIPIAHLECGERSPFFGSAR